MYGRNNWLFWVAVVILLILVWAIALPYGMWWALSYFHVINNPWDFYTWLAIFIIWSAVGGIGARFRKW